MRRKWSGRGSQEAKCRKKLSPAPAERVKEVLMFIEAKDSSYFFRLCQELTLVGDSTHYGFSAILNQNAWLGRGNAGYPSHDCRSRQAIAS